MVLTITNFKHVFFLLAHAVFVFGEKRLVQAKFHKKNFAIKQKNEVDLFDGPPFVFRVQYISSELTPD